MDKSQFISVIGTLQESVRRFLIVLTHGDKELTDDLAQNAIIKAYLHYGTFDGRAKLQTWIFRIAYNEYLNEQNCYWKRNRDAIDDNDKAKTMIADDQADRSFLYEPLYQAIDQLPKQAKAIVVLYYLEEKNIREIHQITQLSETTIAVTLFRARKQLKTILVNEYKK